MGDKGFSTSVISPESSAISEIREWTRSGAQQVTTPADSFGVMCDIERGFLEAQRQVREILERHVP